MELGKTKKLEYLIQICSDASAGMVDDSIRSELVACLLELQSYKERETVLRPTYSRDMVAHCPRCKAEVHWRKDFVCLQCGQRLRW